jgi:hypothetical protein
MLGKDDVRAVLIDVRHVDEISRRNLNPLRTQLEEDIVECKLLYRHVRLASEAVDLSCKSAQRAFTDGTAKQLLHAPATVLTQLYRTQCLYLAAAVMQEQVPYLTLQTLQVLAILIPAG